MECVNKQRRNYISLSELGHWTTTFSLPSRRWIFKYLILSQFLHGLSFFGCPLDEIEKDTLNGIVGDPAGGES